MARPVSGIGRRNRSGDHGSRRPEIGRRRRLWPGNVGFGLPRERIERLQGIDNITVPGDSLLIPHENFMTHDLSKPLRLDAPFDLVVSLEVAEHLPESSAATFVETPTSLGPVEMFSAEIPR